MSELTIIQWVTAVATAASALFIAVQAFLTRRSVEMSREGVLAAVESARIASNALRESQLARLEAGVPRLTLTCPAFPDEPAQLLEPGADGVAVWKSIDRSMIFKLPRDADKELRLRHKVVIRNDGPGAASIQWPFLTFSPGRLGPLNVGESRECTVQIRRPVREWIEMLESGGGDEPELSDASPLCGTLQFVYEGPRDADITETHTVEFRGSPLAPVKDAVGDWTASLFFTGPEVIARTLPATRTYWKSRSEEEKF